MTARLLLLLPPSETKRDGGNAAFGGRLVGAPAESGAALGWRELDPIRERVADDLVQLSLDAETATRALKISAKLAEVELARNRELRTAPRMPAALRYTGVLYDALDAASLDDLSQRWLREHVAVHSALYGLVGAGEEIAAYRLSSSSRLGGPALKRRWADAVARVLEAHDGLVVDLRSKGYQALGPAPRSALRVDVVTRDADGALRSLNHFNKQAKGEFVRALAGRLGGSGLEPTTSDEFAAVARDVGVEFELRPDGARLIAPDPVAAR